MGPEHFVQTHITEPPCSHCSKIPIMKKCSNEKESYSPAFEITEEVQINEQVEEKGNVSPIENNPASSSLFINMAKEMVQFIFSHSSKNLMSTFFLEILRS